jgi:hypothetical protein
MLRPAAVHAASPSCNRRPPADARLKVTSTRWLEADGRWFADLALALGAASVHLARRKSRSAPIQAGNNLRGARHLPDTRAA